MTLFPPKHPYYKAPAEAKAKVTTLAKEMAEQQRVQSFIDELPNNLTEAEKKAIAEHLLKIEKQWKFTKGKAMSIDDADKQSANPKYHNGLPFQINCQTCAPAYMLRLLGFDVTAKGYRKGTKQEYLGQGMHLWEEWQNTDGTPAKHSSINDWLAAKGYSRDCRKLPQSNLTI